MQVSGDSEEDGELENVELPERSAEESSRRRKMLDTGEKLTQFMQGFSTLLCPHMHAPHACTTLPSFVGPTLA